MSNSAVANVETEVLDCCPNCHSKNLSKWCEAHDRLLGLATQTFAYHRCNDCDILFQSHRPVESAISLFYPEDYAPYAGAGGKRGRWQWIDRAALWATDRLIGSAEFKSRMDTFYEALDAKPVVLDFGCGSGKFLDIARAKGCETIGMDFSPVALAHVAGRGHRALAISDVDWQAIADRSVGLIRMNHVVEHLYDPRRVLGLLCQKLRPGGSIHIATPNAASFSAELYHEHWFSLDCPRHIMIFTPRSLSNLARDCRFEDIEVVQEPLTKDMVRSHLYREVDGGRLDRENVIAAHSDGALALKFARASRRAVQLQRCDRIHLLARAA
ncbi:MAG: class I SAM-dependent methyltransferase [Verrucomicrobiae bacterium]|nr:class I SAM-dependent methyltransferase [Verrucomicrobiae bacterium]